MLPFTSRSQEHSSFNPIVMLVFAIVPLQIPDPNVAETEYVPGPVTSVQ